MPSTRLVDLESSIARIKPRVYLAGRGRRTRSSNSSVLTRSVQRSLAGNQQHKQSDYVQPLRKFTGGSIITTKLFASNAVPTLVTKSPVAAAESH